jgi:DNA-binding transcriptional MerR regulator
MPDMTIKEFSQLCGCNPQTLRYYDSVQLLRPIKADPFTGYRCYDEGQAMQYVKIKNLQMAGFSISEIKGILDADDGTIYKELSKKIAEQESLLAKMKEIQRSYTGEMQKMKEKVKEFREKILKIMENYNPSEEFGIDCKEYKKITDSIGYHLNRHEFKKFEYDFSSNKCEKNQGKEYLKALDDPNFEVAYEAHGWEHAKELKDKFTLPEDAKEYMLLFAISKSKKSDAAFAVTALAVMLGKKAQPKAGEASPKLACNVAISDDGKNHFWLLVSRK